MSTYYFDLGRVKRPDVGVKLTSRYTTKTNTTQMCSRHESIATSNQVRVGS